MTMKIKSNFIFLFLIIFSIFIIPSNVFAEVSSNSACSGTYPCLNEVDSTGLGNFAVNTENLSYVNLKIGSQTYKAYFFTGTSDSSYLETSKFDVSSIGFEVMIPKDKTKFTDTLEKDLYEVFFSHGCGFLNYEDIVSSLPYFSLYKADLHFDQIITFTYTDTIMLRKYGNSIDQLIPYSSDLPFNLAALTFGSVYKNDSSKVIVFSLIDNVNLRDSSMVFTWEDYLHYTTVDNIPYHYLASFNNYFDSSLHDDSLSDILSNNLYFSSNSNIVSSSGEHLDYSNYQDISNSGSNNPSSFDIPTDLGDILAMIPELLSDMVSAFSVVGAIFTTAMNSFPPIITVGLYSVFILGILILIIKVLK